MALVPLLSMGAGRGSAHAPWGSFMGKRLAQWSLPPSSPLSCLTPSGKERFGASAETRELAAWQDAIRPELRDSLILSGIDCDHPGFFYFFFIIIILGSVIPSIPVALIAVHTAQRETKHR